MTLALPQLSPDTENYFDPLVRERSGHALQGESIDTVQVNIGLRCNLACHHCHVESSPTRSEEMSWNTMERVLTVAKNVGAKTLDITGGAPEMHVYFRRFVAAAVDLGLDVMVRTNLTILLEDGYNDLPTFLRDHRVALVASLPCYLEKNVDQQRGRHVYQESIKAIVLLNGLGYGIEPWLPLDLVYNAVGPSLPPAQKTLENEYRRELGTRFGIRFTRLFTLTNLPIGRFLHELASQGKDRPYRDLLVKAFNPATLEGLMCRHQLHVGWDGRLFDCDFNFALNLPADAAGCGHVRDFDKQKYLRRFIVTGNHCFGCTAGCGSSCGGALV